jgi:methyltransferase family protein
VSSLEAHLRRQIEHSRYFFWHRLRWLAVAAHLPAGGSFRLLDVGAGAGLLGVFLRRDFPQATYMFVEPIDSLQRYLESSYGATANAAGQTSFAGVEYVTLLDVLEHQEDDRRFLGDLLKRMAPGTILIITVPALMSLWSGWDLALGHHRRYDRTSLRRAIDGLPVEVMEMSFLFPEMIPLGLVRKRLKAASPNGPPAAESAAFPDLPRLLNDGLYALGRCSLALRRYTPVGSSLLAVLRKT